MSTKYFIGREIELNSIMDNIKSKDSDTKIINIYGIGGAGKTTLINKMFEKIEEDNIEIVTFKINEDIEYKNLPNFVDSLSKLIKIYNLNNYKIDFSSLSEKYVQYQKISGEIETKLSDNEKSELKKIQDEIVKISKNKGKSIFQFPQIKIGIFDLNLFKYQKAEMDGEKAFQVLKEHYDSTHKRIIEERYKDPDSQKFYLNPMPTLTDEFIEGIYKTVFYDTGIFIEKRPNLSKKPIKLLFVIDTFEKLSDDINDWLLIHLLPSLEKNKIYYDYRILISGREQLILTDRRWDSYKILEKDIHRFSKEEVKLYLEMHNLNDEKVEEAYNATDGLAYLLDLWVENKENPGALFYSQSSDRIFWWVNDEDKREWIRMASFLDGYDQDSLQLFLGDKKIAEDAFNWLSRFHEITRTSKTINNKFDLHSTVKKIITKSVEQQSLEKFNKYTNIARFYKEITSKFENMEERGSVKNFVFLRWLYLMRQIQQRVNITRVVGFVKTKNYFY